MATAVPAMSGKFGSTTYYITTMKASDVSSRLRIPKELSDWEDMTIEERFQREINYNRVKKHIATYLAFDPDRFFGALIVDIYNPEGVSFEPLGEVGKLPGLYKTAAAGFGFLHFTGGEVLVPLDGQHRLAAMRFAITGKDQNNKDIPGLDPNFDVANDDVVLILVRHDEKRARKIFNKVNRYAKGTSKTENLVTADDDIVAVFTRLVANSLISERIVNYQSNTLNAKAVQFTTLPTLYDSSVRILESTFSKKIDTTALPDGATQTLYKQELMDVWNHLLDNVELFKLALADKAEGGDAKRQEIRKDFLLGKPICQQVLVMSFLRLRESVGADGSKLSDEEITNRLNALNWSVDNPMWQRVLMNGNKVVAGKQAALFAARFVSYLCGERLENVEVTALLDNYKGLFPKQEQKSVKLPEPTFK